MSFRRHLLLLLGLVCALGLAPASAATNARIFELPGDNVYPEGIAYDDILGYFYTGATADGTLFRGDVATGEVTVLSPGGTDGRSVAVGMKLDGEGGLYVAGGPTGILSTVDTEDGKTLESRPNGITDGSTFLNDVAVTPDDEVFVTDSMQPTIWKAGGGKLEPWLELAGSPIVYQEGFNLNGIISSDDGSMLLVVQANTGGLYRIDIASKTVEAVDLGGEVLTGGDGMLLTGNTLFVVRNGAITIVTMSDDLGKGKIAGEITDESFSSPTTIASTGACLLVVNSQFANQGSPVLPFTVSGIAIPAESRATPVAADTDVRACALG